MQDIGFKQGVSYSDFVKLTPETFLLVAFVSWYFKRIFNKPCIITSIKMDREKPNEGVHALYRAVDFRTHAINCDQKLELMKAINDNFYYGEKFKCALVHGFGENEHLHVQAPGDNFKNFVRHKK